MQTHANTLLDSKIGNKALGTFIEVFRGCALSLHVLQYNVYDYLFYN